MIMPKDYAKQVNKRNANKQKKRSQSRKKQSRKSGVRARYWIMFSGVVVLGALGVTAEFVWWPSMFSQNPSQSVPVKTRQPDYQRASSTSSHHSGSLPFNVEVNHKQVGLQNNTCQHRQRGVLTLGKLSKTQQTTVHNLLATKQASGHLHHVDATSSWQIGPQSISKLRLLQKHLYKNQIYSVINCR